MKLRLQITYKPKQGKKNYEINTDFMPVSDALLLSEDLEKTGRTETIEFIDETESIWLKKQLKKYLESLKEDPHNVIVYFDGGYDKEERLSGVGTVILYTQNDKFYRIRKNEKLEQLTSNNEAEFAALWLAINELEAIGVHHLPITIRGDSLVVINQASGEWPCYEEDHTRWLDRIDEKAEKIGLKLQYELIQRGQNKEADQLASQALDDVFIHATSEVKKYE